MNEEELSSYIVRYCKHDLTETEYRRLEGWLAEKEENRKLFEQMLAVYRQGRKVGCWKAIREEVAWKIIAHRISNSSSGMFRRRMRIWWKYAAVLVVLLGGGLLYEMLRVQDPSVEFSSSAIAPGNRKAVLELSDGRRVALEEESNCILTEKNGTRITVGGEKPMVYEACSEMSKEPVYNTIRVPRGGEYSLVLSDGSRVWLNAGTELTFPAVFGEKERKLLLKGEAYFEVLKDTARPFIVESLHNRVEVLGTRFNVSAYEETAAVKTTLLQGSVRVSNGKKELILQPGEQAVSEIVTLAKRKVDTQSIVAWVNGVFEFENMSLGEITDQLGRWYDVDFLFMDPTLREITFTGAATRYRELDFVLRRLEELAHVHFHRQDKMIKVSKQ